MDMFPTVTAGAALHIIPEEMRQIDTEYEDFGKWVNSSGYYYKNWYNNYRYAK